MPGIIGFCGTTDQQAADNLLSAMVDAMRDEENYSVDTYAEAGFGLGRIHLNIIDSRPQPLWSKDGAIGLVMTGEIFSWDEQSIEKSALRQGEEFSNADLLLAAYSHWGDDFVNHVNGTFAAAIWDQRQRRLLVVNDHLGVYPIYYAYIQNCLVFGSGARAVAQAPGLPRAVNVDTVAELMAFEHVYGDKTLFSGVQLLPPATILCWQDGKLQQSTYEDYQYPQYYELQTEEHYIEQWIYYMRQAVARQTRPPAPLGVLLTGGLDSRTILAMMDRSSIDIVTMTFGISGCDDDAIACEIARTLHLPHKFFPLAPDYLAQQGAKGVRITDGMKSCAHFNVIGPLSQLVEESRVLYKGYLGGTIHGYVVSHDRLAPLREEEWFEFVFAERNRIFAEREWPHIYTDPMLSQVRDVPRESLRRALARSHSTWWVDKDSYVDLYEEDVRFTVLGVELARSQAVVRTPLADKDLLRFTMSVPPGFRVDKSYYQKAITKAFPTLAKIPTTATGRPVMRESFRDLRWRANQQLRWWLRNRGLSMIPMRMPRPYANYAEWMRHELRPWVEQTLLSPQALDRDYFQPSYIRNLVAEHMAGSNHTRRLGILLSLELWHQQYMD